MSDTREYNFNLFHEISERLSRWKEFGKLINLEEHIIEIIEVAHPTCYERAYQCMKTKNEMSKEKCLKSDWMYWKSILTQLGMEGLKTIQYIEDKYPILHKYITDIVQRKVDTPEYNFNLFHEISGRLSRWKEFGRLINLEEHIIEIIEVAHPTCYEKAYQCMKTKNEMSKEKCLKSDWIYWKSILIQLDNEGLNAIQYIEEKYPILLRYITDIEQRKVDDTKETPVKSSAIELHVNGKQMTKYELIVDNNFSNSHIGNVKVINDNSVIHNHYHSSTELRSISSVSSSLEVSSSLLDDTQETPVTSLAIEHHVVDHHCIYDGCGMFGHDATNENNFETIPINEETRIKVNMGAGEIKTFSLRKLKDLPHLQEEYFNNYPLLKDITKYDFSKDALTRECQILSMLSTWLNGDGFIIRGYNVDKHFELFTKGSTDEQSNDDSHITMFSQKQSVIVHMEIASNDIHESFRKNLRQIKLFRSLHDDSVDKGIVHIPLLLYDSNVDIEQVKEICNQCVSLQLIAPIQIVKDINQWEQWWDNVSEHIADMKYELKNKTSTEDVTQTLLSSIVTFMALTEFNLPTFATNPKKQSEEFNKLILLFGHNIEGIVPRIYYPSYEKVPTFEILRFREQTFCITLLLDKIIEGKDKYVIVCMNEASFKYLYLALAIMDTYKYTHSANQFFHGDYQILVTDYTTIRGCEYANIILIYPNNESHLKHHVVDCISRCLYKLRIIVFDEFNENDLTLMQILCEWEKKKISGFIQNSYFE